MGRRRQFTAEFKSKIVLEILKEEKPIGELAAEHGLSPNQLRNWKKEFLENADKVFSESKQEKELRAKERELDEERTELMAKVGLLTIKMVRTEAWKVGKTTQFSFLSEFTKKLFANLPKFNRIFTHTLLTGGGV